jgi:hypothetical protein
MERFLPFNRRFIEHYVLRVTRLVASWVLSPWKEADFWHWCSVAVQVYNGTRDLSWCRELIARCGACPDVSALQICHKGRNKSKNRDNSSRAAGNNLPFVRVRWS